MFHERSFWINEVLRERKAFFRRKEGRYLGEDLFWMDLVESLEKEKEETPISLLSNWVNGSLTGSPSR